jgi:hypothetical protein
VAFYVLLFPNKTKPKKREEKRRNKRKKKRRKFPSQRNEELVLYKSFMYPPSKIYIYSLKLIPK